MVFTVLNRFFLFLFLLIILSCAQKSQKKIILAKEGTIDLTSWDFEKNGIIALDGDWELYWEKYYEPIDFKNPQESDGFIKVPHRWNHHILKGKTLSIDGFATFRLNVKLKKSDTVKAFRISIQNTAYKFWVNGKLLTTTGTFGTTKSSMTPKYLPKTIEFYTEEDHLEIVMNVSNYHNRFGGIRTPIELGLSQDIKSAREKSIALDLFVFGSLFIIGLYYFAIYFLRTKDSSALFFALYAILYATKSVFEGERFFINIFPEFPWEWDLKISYFITYLAPPLFGTFLYTLFQEEFNKKILRTVQVIGIILVPLVLITEARFYSILAIPHQIYIIILGIYVFYVFYLAIKNKKSGSRILLVGYISYFFLAAINDSLYSAGIIETYYLSAYALFLFVLSQGLALAIRFSKAFLAVENLTTDLSRTNRAYGRFIPREFLRFLDRKNIQDVQLGDQIQKEMTVLFSDIRSFTELSESMSPVDNFNFINSYFKRINPIIRKNNGFIDKFIGDAVMAIFPDSSDDALSAAIAIQNEIKEYNKERVLKSYRPIQIGLGINTGYLMMGTVGDDDRMDTTVIGDTVNLASRLESLTKEYYVPIILSEFAVGKLNELEKFHIREIDSVVVKGKSMPINIYECFDVDNEESLNSKEKSSSHLLFGLTEYQLGNFSKALTHFIKAQQLCKDDPIPVLHINRCQDIIAQSSNVSEGVKYKASVLCVEDNAAIQKLIEKVLNKNNFSIQLTGNGKDALKIIQSSNPDIILVDLHLPDINGFDLIQKIREAIADNDYNPIFVILSGDESKEYLFRALSIGVRDFLPKPIDFKKLLEIMNKRISERQI